MTDGLRSLASESEAQTVRAPALSEPSSGAVDLLTVLGGEARCAARSWSWTAAVKRPRSRQRSRWWQAPLFKGEPAARLGSASSSWGDDPMRRWPPTRTCCFTPCKRPRAAGPDLSSTARRCGSGPICGSRRGRRRRPSCCRQRGRPSRCPTVCRLAGAVAGPAPAALLGQPSAMDLFQMAESFTDNIYARSPHQRVMGNTGKTLSLQASILHRGLQMSRTEGADLLCANAVCI